MAKNTQKTDVDTNNISEIIKAAAAEAPAEPAQGDQVDNQEPAAEVTQEPEQGGNTEGQDVAKAAQWGSFKIETGIVPERAAAGSSKYDWASFPAPSNPDDPRTWPSVFIPNIGGKTIYGSLKAYRDKLQKEGKAAPEFTVSVSKDPKGVRVIRKS